MNLPIELRTRVYNHIGNVQRHLGALEADEQREILESIETHIHDALESRSTGEPTLALLDAIIAEMDPPESYGPTNSVYEKDPGITPLSISRITESKSRVGKGCAIVAVVLLAVCVIPPIILLLSYRSLSSTPEPIIEKEIIATPQNEPNSKPAISKAQAPAPSPIIGKWMTIDFVASITEFSPPQTNWKGELELKGLQFFSDGKTDNPGWTWQVNRLFHSGDLSEAVLKIVTVNQSEYLFIEWISGDVLINKEKPKYYVLKRGAYIDPAIPKTITEGVGWKALHLGATRVELIAEFGPPDRRNSMVMAWEDRHIACHLSGDKNSALHEAVQLNFGNGFAGTTSKGIKMGSTEEEVLAAYGNPERISTSNRRVVIRPGFVGTPKTMTWPETGIQITFSALSEVSQIDIFKPYTP